MTHQRYYIRDGATTSADGIVRASGSFASLDGRALAREGDRVDYPACGEQGATPCVRARLADRSEGKECAPSDEPCLCTCSPPPTLLAARFSFVQSLAEPSPA
ncbi:PAAR domain-containing protein [Massilia sp. X63]|uniref:PAAR domain-containing protein n=1 Tax=Massilia sp. X63 TaxID=3237285 RepID=UPI0034DD3087